jgi:type II secretory pathway pseudopilin PulG
MSPVRTRHLESGLMLLALLVAIAIGGLLSVRAFEGWATLVERDKESELLYVGDQYVQAIGRYYFAVPGAARQLPDTLDVLVKDDRFPQPLRHLRELYGDPMQPGAEWGVVRVGPKIVGVYSTSQRAPLKKAGFDRIYEGFSTARSLQDWKFLFRPPAMPWTGSQMPITENVPAPDGGTASRAPAAPGRGRVK